MRNILWEKRGEPVLSLLFKIGKKKNTLEETVLNIQKGNETLKNDLIKQYQPFIAKTVSSVCKRYIDESADEFSIGLIAFNEAIEKYSIDKGSSLLAFAEVLIKRRTIDYIRKQARNRSIPFDMNQSTEEDGTPNFEIDLSLEEFQKEVEAECRKDEIRHYQLILNEFGLSFHDLVEHSPKHVDARQNAIKIAHILVSNPELKEQLFTKKQLPIKKLENLVHVSRKTIERNRKYIIAISIILTGDYVYLKDYLKGVLET